MTDDVYVDRNHSTPMQDWLSDAGSFMQRLKRYGVKNAQIRVLREGWSLPVADERAILNVPFRRFAWVREVSIHSGDTLWMFARTVIPQETLTGKERILQHLKTRSLGSILFAYPELERSQFDYFSVNADSSWHKKIARYVSVPDESLWARRSIFTWHEKSLLLTEVFFPEIAAL